MQKDTDNIESLHIPLERGQNDIQIFQKFTEIVFAKVLSDLNSGSSAGPSGWTVNLLKKICEGKDGLMLLFFNFY